jgi:hypothetical protein
MSQDVDEMAQCNAKVFGKHGKVTGSSRFEKHGKVTGSSRFEKHRKAQTIYNWQLSSLGISSFEVSINTRIHGEHDKLLDINWTRLPDFKAKVMMQATAVVSAKA